MKAEFFTEQPPVRITPWGEKIYIFLALNGEWGEQEGENTPVWRCDYREIITTPDKIDIDKVRENPSAFMEWEEPIPPTLENRVESLELYSDDVILFMADLIGGENA